MKEHLSLLVGLIVIALAIAATAFTGHWVLRPMAKESRLLNLPTRFSLGDFVCLLLLLQIVLAAVLAVVPVRPNLAASLTAILLFFGGSVTVLWAFGISSLSRAGIKQTLRRGVFTVFLLPVLVLLMMATGIGCFVALEAVLAPLLNNEVSFEVAKNAFFAMIGFVAWALITWSFRKVAEWVLGGNRVATQRQANETDSSPPTSPSA